MKFIVHGVVRMIWVGNNRDDELMSEKPFKQILLDGTFDRLHSGHKELLRVAALLGNELSIGVTSNPMIGVKRLSMMIEDYDIRVENLRKYLKDYHSDIIVSIEQINNIYSNILNSEADAIVISTEAKVYANCLDINNKRRVKGQKELIIVVVPRVLDEYGKIISSTKRREEERSNVLFKD